jgi:ankyrin repeat protein
MMGHRIMSLTIGMLTLFLGVRWVRQVDLNYQLVNTVYFKKPIDHRRLKALLAHGADPNAKGPKDVMVLSWAVVANDLEASRILLDAGADPECRGGWLPAPDLAVGGDDAAAVNLLLSRGAHANDLSGMSPLLVCAVTEGQSAVVAVLLRHGANPNSRDSRTRTVLNIARAAGSRGIVRLLERAGAREQPEPPKLTRETSRRGSAPPRRSR